MEKRFLAAPGAREAASVRFSLEEAGLDVLKVSPFVWRAPMGWRVSEDKSCSVQEASRMIRTGLFTKLHELVLCILQDYTYLNAFLLRERIAYLEHREAPDAKNFRKVLKFMVDAGFLRQYELTHVDPEGNEEGSPFIYALSAGGSAYLRRRGRLKSVRRRARENKPAPFKITEALEILAENQFSILFEKQYMDSGCVSYAQLCGDVYKACGIRMLYGLRLPSGGELALFAFAVRGHEGWEEFFLSRLEGVRAYAGGHGFCAYSILVVTENECQAMACERERCSRKEAGLSDVFYSTDTAFLMENDVFCHLIEVQMDGEGARRCIFQLKLRNEQ